MTGALASVAIPAVMILLSTTLPARANRATNLVAASLYIPYSIFNLIDASWVLFYGLGVVVEVLLLAFILRAAWTWPRTSSMSTAEPAATPGLQIQTGR